jgi:hypothetical protein
MSENKTGYSSTTDTSYVTCPYFVGHGKREIRCEGTIGCSKCSHLFLTEEDKRFHKKNYCENRYTRCEHYLSIEHWRWPDE